MDKRLDECVDGWLNGGVVVVMWMNEYLIGGWIYRVIYLRVGSWINGWAEGWTCRIMDSSVGRHAVMCG